MDWRLEYECLDVDLIIRIAVSKHTSFVKVT
jgi:hypothetical protein